MAMLDSETTVKNYHVLLNARKLCAAECTSCNFLMLPPRLLCPNCNSKNTIWKELEGHGKISSFTVIHIAGTSFAEDVPYFVAIIQLAEGPSICARLVGVDPLKPEEIQVGDAVVAEFDEVPGPTLEEKITRLVFRPET